MKSHLRQWFAVMGVGVAMAACSSGGATSAPGSGGRTMGGSGGTQGTGGASGGAIGGSGGATSGSGGAIGSGGATSGSGGIPTGTGGGSGGAATGSGGAATASGGSGGASSSGGATTPGSGGATAASGGAGGGPGAGGTAGATAGRGGSASSPCAARAGLLFYDDFEAKTTGPLASAAPWVAQTIGSGTLTIDATLAHSGGKSLHVHAGADDYDTLLAFHDPTVLPAPNGKFYARVFVRLGRAMAAGHNSYIIADPFAAPGSGNNLRIGEDNGMLMYTLMGDGHGALSNASYYTDQKPGVVFAPLSWVCLEILIDAGHPEIDFWVDGTEVPDLHHTDWAMDSYDTIRFGFEKYAGPGIDLWYDDIAISTARIGCQ